MKFALAVTVALAACGSPAGPGAERVILHRDFNRHAEGVYTPALLEADWHPAHSRGVKEGRARIVGPPEALGGKSLEVRYSKGVVGPEGGAQFLVRFAAHEELFLEYRLKFGKGFDFVKGGKLPGLAGGDCNTGGRKPAGEGWSARYMWRSGGRLVLYLYHMDQPTQFGQDFPLDVTARPGTWICLRQRIRMNTPGRKDGTVEVWADGKKALDLKDLRFRSAKDVAIDAFYFDTFFGGSEVDWAPPDEERAYFDGFKVFSE